MAAITQEAIDYAKSRDLTELFRSAGFTPKRVGSTWTLKEIDSISISRKNNGTWLWNRFSEDKGGDNITFAMEFLGANDFKSAVEMLTEGRVFERTNDYRRQSQVREDKKKPIPLEELHEVPNRDTAIAYLTKKRGLSMETIKPFLDNNTIRQNKYGNAVFCSFNENGKLVKANAVITSDYFRKKSGHKSFLAKGSDGKYGFEIKRGEPQKAYFCESEIDALSFLQLHDNNIDNCLIVGLNGVSANEVKATMSRHGIESKDVYICTDNDDAGNKLYQTLSEEYPDMQRMIPPDNFKDWNDVIRGIPIDEINAEKAREKAARKDEESVSKNNINAEYYKELYKNYDTYVTDFPTDKGEKVMRALDESGIKYSASYRDDDVVKITVSKSNDVGALNAAVKSVDSIQQNEELFADTADVDIEAEQVLWDELDLSGQDEQEDIPKVQESKTEQSKPRYDTVNGEYYKELKSAGDNFTKVYDADSGKKILNELDKQGVQVSYVNRANGKIGITVSKSKDAQALKGAEKDLKPVGEVQHTAAQTSTSRVNAEYMSELRGNKDVFSSSFGSKYAENALKTLDEKGVKYSAEKRKNGEVVVSVSKSDKRELSALEGSIQKFNTKYYMSMPQDERHTVSLSGRAAAEIMNKFKEKDIPFSAIGNANKNISITVSNKSEDIVSILDTGKKNDLSAQEKSFSSKEKGDAQQTRGNAVNYSYYMSLRKSNDVCTQKFSNQTGKEILASLATQNVKTSSVEYPDGSIGITVSKSKDAQTLQNALNAVSERTQPAKASTQQKIEERVSKKGDKLRIMNPDYYKSVPKEERDYIPFDNAKTAQAVLGELNTSGVPYSASYNMTTKKTTVTFAKSDKENVFACMKKAGIIKPSQCLGDNTISKSQKAINKEQSNRPRQQTQSKNVGIGD